MHSSCLCATKIEYCTQTRLLRTVPSWEVPLVTSQRKSERNKVTPSSAFFAARHRASIVESTFCLSPIVMPAAMPPACTRD